MTTTDDSTTPIHAFVRSDVVRSAFLAPLQANGWTISSLRNGGELEALLRDAPFAVVVVDGSVSHLSPAMPGPWVQGLFVGTGEGPDGLSSRPFSTPVAQIAADLRRLAFIAQLAALRAGRVHQARGFLQDVPLRSCLAALLGRKASGTIRFDGPRGTGSVYVRDGLVIDVEVAALRGEEALARLLGWAEGNVVVAEGSVLGDALMQRPIEELFAESERMASTVSAAIILLPKAGVPMELERFMASRIVPQPSPELDALLALIDGVRDINAILDASPFDDASTARTLARFAQGGALRAAGSSSQLADVSPPSMALVSRFTPVALPQVTHATRTAASLFETDAPTHANAAPASAPSGSADGNVQSLGAPTGLIGASTPRGLFAAPAAASGATGDPQASSAAYSPAPTPMAPGAEYASEASDSVPERGTPISVETPAKAALDAAFRKAAQESQAALAASQAAEDRLRPSPSAVKSATAKAMYLVGIIGIIAAVLFAAMAIKSLQSPAAALPRVSEPAPAAPAPVPAVTADTFADKEVPVPPVPAEATEATAGDDGSAARVVEASPAAALTAPAVDAAARPVAAPAPARPAFPSPVPAVKLPPGRLDRAKLFLDQGNFVSATIEAQAVVQGDPAQAEAWLVLGAAAQAQGKHAEATHFFNECVRRGKGVHVAECRQFATP